MFQSVPGVGGEKKEEEGLTREELQEQERLRSVQYSTVQYSTVQCKGSPGRSCRSRRGSVPGDLSTSRCQLLLLVESVETNQLLFHLMC